MEPLQRYRIFIGWITSDPRITSVHISLITAICYYWLLNPAANSIQISRRQLMHLSHIRSIATYHKAIKELNGFGYIVYHPSFHPKMGSRITLCSMS